MGHIAQSLISGVEVCHCPTGKVLFRNRGGVAYILHEVFANKQPFGKNVIMVLADQLISEAEQLLKANGIYCVKVVLSTKAELTDEIFNAFFYSERDYYIDVKTRNKIVLSKML